MKRREVVLWTFLLLIFIIGTGLRLTHFSDWLIYEIDQSRDNIIVSEALLYGQENLPLLGPRAAGTQLRLGPVYYYMEYVSALFFGDTPQGHTYFIPILSIASIILLFFLLRRFFNVWISLGMSYLYTISLFAVVYARFGWNPNVTPFFIIAGLLAFFKSMDTGEKHPGRWFVTSIVAFGIATQLHYIIFFFLPAFVVGYLLYKRPRFSWKAWVISILFLATLYSPMVVSDITTRGFNIGEFMSSFEKKTNHKDTITEKAVDVMRSGASSYALILTGNDRIWMPKIQFENWRIEVTCKNSCKKTSKYVYYSAIAFFLLGSFLLLWRAWKYRGPDIGIALFFFLSCFVFLQVSNNIEPRFYLFVVFLPFFFLGSMLEVVWKKKPMLGGIVLVAILLIFSYMNTTRLFDRFSDINRAHYEKIKSSSDRVTGEQERVSLRQFRLIVDEMVKKSKENGFPVLLKSESRYERSLKYLTEKQGVEVGILDKRNVYKDSNHFAVFRTRKSGNITSYLEYYDLVNEKEFGTMTLFELAPKEGIALAEGNFETLRSFDSIMTWWQLTWKDAFHVEEVAREREKSELQ